MRHAYRLAFGFLVFLFALTRGALAQDTPQRSWTHIGAAGVPDESSAPLRFGSNGAVAVGLSVAAPARVVLRYNITAVNGLFANEAPNSEGLPLCLHVRYRDTGPDARVVVRIREVSFGIFAGPGEHVRTLITFNSDSQSGSGSREYVGATVCSTNLAFQFFQHAYFAEVELLKLGPRGDPGLHAFGIQLDFD
jgi:hypothetical protein